MLDHLGDFRTTATHAVLTGDPERVDRFSQELDGAVATWHPRGYHLAEVRVGGQPLIVAGTGIGGPSTAIVIEELGAAGIRTFVRVGTCGSLGSSVAAGEIVVSTGAVRDEGTSHQYLPASFPAVPDFQLLQRIVTSLDHRCALGITHCKDAYYAERAGEMADDWWRARWALLRRMGVLATEMEAAPMFTIATVRRWAAAALFVAVDDSLSADRRMGALIRGLHAAVDALLPTG